jgi:shikimate dehydrogenase
MPKGETIKAAVLGWPVKHSLSPRLHRFWLAEHGINGSYEAIEVEPNDLEKTLHRLADEGYAGVNLTVPHKQEALKIIDHIDEQAEYIGAVNTLTMDHGKMSGINTDMYGFTQNLKTHGVTLKGKALVLGAGGASRAVCAGLLCEGMEVTLLNRTSIKAVDLAEELGGNIKVRDWDFYPDAMKDTNLVVNTTSLGMKGQAALTLKLDTLPKDAVVTDIVYNPLFTPLLKQAQARGNTIVDGLGMLLYQAQPAFQLFFGVKPEVTEALRAHVLKGLS